MASIFLQLIQMAVEIKKISNYFDPNFKKNCINIFNKRWAQFDTDTYLVAFFLHPRYRGKVDYFSNLFVKYNVFIIPTFHIRQEISRQYISSNGINCYENFVKIW
jgi:hypothetical protein